MEHVPAMVDLKREDGDLPGIGCEYSPGLYITFDDEVLKKLNLDTEDVQVGDFIHLHAMCKVTGVSESDHETMGSHKAVNLVMAFVSAEDEQSEDAEDDKRESTSARVSKLYTKG